MKAKRLFVFFNVSNYCLHTLLKPPFCREIREGFTPIIDCHTAHVACVFSDIKQKIDRKTGEVLELDPEGVSEGDACIVEMEPTKPLSLESFHEFPPLGRFSVRDMRHTVAVGVVKSITKCQPGDV